ncbi:hypothetical protein [Bacillus velezensis]|uniref:hypothetical protein n=1 Tax=Bacillus velezensis TaxID=492670 RepID=UPI002FBE60F5
MNDNLNVYINNLEYFIESIEEIINFLQVRNYKFNKNEKEYARELMKSFKDQLNTEANSIKKVRKKVGYDDICFNNYFAGISDASIRIYKKWNSVPDEKWVHELVDARYSIRHYLTILKRKLK